MKDVYFCPHCKKIMRPLDSAIYRKIGECLDCESDIHTHLVIKKSEQKLKIFNFLKTHPKDLFFEEETHDIVIALMKVIRDDEVDLVDGAQELTNAIKNNN